MMKKTLFALVLFLAFISSAQAIVVQFEVYNTSRKQNLFTIDTDRKTFVASNSDTYINAKINKIYLSGEVVILELVPGTFKIHNQYNVVESITTVAIWPSLMATPPHFMMNTGANSEHWYSFNAVNPEKFTASLNLLQNELRNTSRPSNNNSNYTNNNTTNYSNSRQPANKPANLKTFAVVRSRNLTVSQMAYRPLFVLPEGTRNVTMDEVINHLKSYSGWKWGISGQSVRLSRMKGEYFDMKYSGIVPKYTGVGFENGKIDAYDWQVVFTQQAGRQQSMQLYDDLIRTVSNRSGGSPVQRDNSPTRKVTIISDGTREFEISCFKDDNQWVVDFYCKYL